MNVKGLCSYFLCFLGIWGGMTSALPNSSSSSSKYGEVSRSSRVDLPAAEATLDGIQLNRPKRKLPDAHFGAKNAVVGFIFGKIDNIIDSKTRFIDALDRSNIEKNQAYNITVPRPINDFQGLVTAVVSPKISSLTNVLSGLTTGVLGGIGSLSGGNEQNNQNSAAQQGVGNIVQKFFSLSGPIIQSSGGNTGGGKVLPTISPDESGY